MANNIRILKPDMPKTFDLQCYLEKIDSNEIYTNFGPLHEELILRLSRRFGVQADQIALCSNATLALIGTIQTMCSLFPIKNMSLPSWTFAATGVAALSCFDQDKLILVDVGDDWRSSIPSGFDSHLDVLPFGDEIDFSRYRDRDVPIVIDAAASFGSISNINFPSSGDFAVVVSLHATKLLGAGEGGVIISNNKEWVAKFKHWTNYGFSKSRESTFLGSNAKLSEYAAAVGLASLDRWDVVKDKFCELTKFANGISSSLGLDVHPALKKNLVTPYWIIKLHNSATVSKVKEDFDFGSIEHRHWWGFGLHKMPAFKSIAFETLDKTNDLAVSTLGLPFHSQLTELDFDRIRLSLERALSD